MARRFLQHLLVNLTAGYLLFFFSERLFWTTFKSGDHIGELVITWLAYSLSACVFLNIVKRLKVRGLPRIALAGAIYGWLTEGALVGTLYGTEASAPFPLSIIQTALSWHMLLSVVVGGHFLRGAVRQGRGLKTALISVAVGLFWGAWAPFQWRETPPVITPVSIFALHAAVTGGLLAVACGYLSGGAWEQYKPGWFGLSLSIVILGLFYSQQVKTLGARPLVILPLLVGSTLALLFWTRPRTQEEPQFLQASMNRWPCAAQIGWMPLTAIFVYWVQMHFSVPGINPAVTFNSLALAGGVFFLGACVLSARHRLALKPAP